MKETEKQLIAIRIIETNLNVQYEGTTKKDAQEFIGEHMDESKRHSLENSLTSFDIYGK